MQDKDLDDLALIAACSLRIVSRAKARGDRAAADALIDIGSASMTAWCLQCGYSAAAVQALVPSFLEMTDAASAAVH